MPSIDFSKIRIEDFVVSLLVFTLFVASIEAWVQVWLARRAGRPWLEWRERTDAKWTQFGDQTAALLTIMWLALQLTAKFAPVSPRRSESLTTADLLTNLALSGGLTVVLLAILLSSRRPPVEFGMRLGELGSQILDGFRGFFLSILPMAITIVLTASFSLRTEQTQNPLLRLLTETGDPLAIALVCLLAVVIAPLSEELMFRVILQGWLTTIVTPLRAVAMVALLFAAIHGVADGLALLPLAAILGYVFHQRHSYVSVVVIHMLFNGTMLILQILTHR